MGFNIGSVLKGVPGMSTLGAAMGIAGGLGAANSTKRLAGQLQGLAYGMVNDIARRVEPYVDAGKFGISALKSLTANTLMPKIGQESPIIKKEYELSKKGIAKGAEGALAESSRFWGQTGNIGRRRGEALLINEGKETAMSEAGLKYGMAQEGYKDKSLDRLFAALGTQIDAGKFGTDLVSRATETSTGMLSQSYGMQAQARSAPWDAMGQVGGMIYGSAMDKIDTMNTFKLLEKLQKQQQTSKPTESKPGG